MPTKAFATTTEWMAALNKGEVGSRELLEFFLARAERRNPALNAIVVWDIERACAAADRADQARARGQAKGALFGLPMTIKETYERAGLRTNSGFPGFAEHVSKSNAIIAERLDDAGAVIFGKTNIPVLAGDWQSFNPIYGTTNNPWDLSRAPGGSSGGSAAALAAGLTPLEVGSDIGGSIRVPSNWCGVFGIKPTYGIIPLRGHVPGPPGCLADPDLSVAGPMARCAADLDLALELLAGPEPDRAVAWKLSLPPPRHQSLRDFRIAAWLDDPLTPVDSEVRERLEQTLDALERAGAHIDRNARPVDDMRQVLRMYLFHLLPIIISGMPPETLAMLESMAQHVKEDDDSILGIIAKSSTLKHREWLMFNELRAQLRKRMADFFHSYDVVLSPVSPVPAIPHDHREPLWDRSLSVSGSDRPYSDMFGWIALPTLTWLPAAVAPVGQTRHGLPVGIQIIGPYLEDRTCIEMARWIERTLGGFTPPPGYADD